MLRKENLLLKAHTLFCCTAVVSLEGQEEERGGFTKEEFTRMDLYIFRLCASWSFWMRPFQWCHIKCGSKPSCIGSLWAVMQLGFFKKENTGAYILAMCDFWKRSASQSCPLSSKHWPLKEVSLPGPLWWEGLLCLRKNTSCCKYQLRALSWWLFIPWALFLQGSSVGPVLFSYLSVTWMQQSNTPWEICWWHQTGRCYWLCTGPGGLERLENWSVSHGVKFNNNKCWILHLEQGNAGQYTLGEECLDSWPFPTKNNLFF